MKVFAGSAGTWPFVTHAQQYDQKQRVAVFQAGHASGDSEGQAEVTALTQGLKELGWKTGTNIDIDYYWPGSEPDQLRLAAKKITDTLPDLVISRSTPAALC